VGAVHCLAIRTNGTIVGWGGNLYGQLNVPGQLTNAVSVSGGDYHSLGLSSDGQVYAWGTNDSGQISVPAGLSHVVAIAAGGSHSLALKDDGTVVAWGNNTAGQTNVPSNLSNVVAIAAGEAASMALKSDGTVKCWGSGSGGPSGVPPSVSNVVAIAAAGGGGLHNLALIGNGAPSITVQPFSRNITAGPDATLTVMAAGIGPLSYQWQLDGVDIPNATNYRLTLTNVQSEDAGTYTVSVFNFMGSTVSSNALLSVSTPLMLSGQYIAGTGFQITLSGPAGTYSIDASANLTSWSPITTTTIVSGPIVFIDSTATILQNRFYRARQ
jgi:hypothetical protein